MVGGMRAGFVPRRLTKVLHMHVGLLNGGSAATAALDLNDKQNT